MSWLCVHFFRLTSQTAFKIQFHYTKNKDQKASRNSDVPIIFGIDPIGICTKQKSYTSLIFP